MKSNQIMRVIITIPAFNEERTLPHVIAEIKEVMRQTKYKYQILVLNDGSKDKTAQVAKEIRAVVVSNKINLGLAQTFIKEMEECVARKADIIVHTDADGQYDPRHIPQIIAKVEEGFDLVLGSRFSGRVRGMPFLKRVGNKAFARVISSLTKVRITDSTTGFRAFTLEVARDIKFINTFTYTQEQIIRAAKQGFKITEIPINTRPTRASRLFKGPLEYALRAWTNILRIYRDYNPLKFFGTIGLAFLSVGVVIGLWLVYLFITTGRIGKIPSAIVSMLLIIVGIQIISFGFLADMIKR